MARMRQNKKADLNATKNKVEKKNVEDKDAEQAPVKKNVKKESKDLKPGSVAALRAECREKGLKMGSQYKTKEDLLKLLGRSDEIKKKKAKRDKDAPKRPLTAYMRYFASVREKIKNSLGEDATVTSVAKEAGERWKKLSDREKKPFDDAYKKDKKEFDKKFKEYKEEKQKNAAPKRALTAYMFFSKDARSKILAEHGPMSVMDVAKETAKQWKVLTDKQKEPYVKKAEADKKRYEEEMKLWKEKHMDEQPAKKKSKKDKKEKETELEEE